MTKRRNDAQRQLVRIVASRKVFRSMEELLRTYRARAILRLPIAARGDKIEFPLPDPRPDASTEKERKKALAQLRKAAARDANHQSNLPAKADARRRRKRP